MHFVAFLENNHREHECFLFYLQLEGNEEALSRLASVIKRARCYLPYDDSSTFEIDIEHLIPEEAIEPHLKLKMNQYAPLFTKLTGRMVDPFKDINIEELDLYELAQLLDEKFYGARMDEHFSE